MYSPAARAADPANGTRLRLSAARYRSLCDRHVHHSSPRLTAGRYFHQSLSERFSRKPELGHSVQQGFTADAELTRSLRLIPVAGPKHLKKVAFALEERGKLAASSA